MAGHLEVLEIPTLF